MLGKIFFSNFTTQITTFLFGKHEKLTQAKLTDFGGITSDARKTIRVNISSTFIIFHSHPKHFNFISFKSLIEQSSYILITFKYSISIRKIFFCFSIYVQHTLYADRWRQILQIEILKHIVSQQKKKGFHFNNKMETGI